VILGSDLVVAGEEKVEEKEKGKGGISQIER